MSNEIKIKITEEYIEKHKKATQLTQDIANAGGFNGPHGQSRKATAEASLAGINAIFEKGEMSQSDIKALTGFFKDLYEALGKAAANTSEMSKELEKLINAQKKAIAGLDAKRQQQLDLLNQR